MMHVDFFFITHKSNKTSCQICIVTSYVKMFVLLCQCLFLNIYLPFRFGICPFVYKDVYRFQDDQCTLHLLVPNMKQLKLSEYLSLLLFRYPVIVISTATFRFPFLF